MDVMKLASRIAELNAWVRVNAGTEPKALTSEQLELLRSLKGELDQTMHMVMPPGNPCVHCRGSGVEP